MKRSSGILTAVIVPLATFASQPVQVLPGLPGSPTGFFRGFTAIFALSGSLFLPIRIYESPNSGFWYDFGFVAVFSSGVTAIMLASIARIGGMLT